jgi:hypothetical protein
MFPPERVWYILVLLENSYGGSSSGVQRLDVNEPLRLNG